MEEEEHEYGQWAYQVGDSTAECLKLLTHFWPSRFGYVIG